mgnify:CR=1 FL=1
MIAALVCPSLVQQGHFFVEVFSFLNKTGSLAGSDEKTFLPP